MESDGKRSTSKRRWLRFGRKKSDFKDNEKPWPMPNQELSSPPHSYRSETESVEMLSKANNKSQPKNPLALIRASVDTYRKGQYEALSRHYSKVCSNLDAGESVTDADFQSLPLSYDVEPSTTKQARPPSPSSSRRSQSSHFPNLEALIEQDERSRQLLRHPSPHYDQACSVWSTMATCGALDSYEEEHAHPAPVQEPRTRVSLPYSVRRRATFEEPSASSKPEEAEDGEDAPPEPKLRGGGGDPKVECVPANGWFFAGGRGRPPTYEKYRAARRDERKKGKERALEGYWKDIIVWGVPPLEQREQAPKPPKKCCPLKCWMDCSLSCSLNCACSCGRSSEDQPPRRGQNPRDRRPRAQAPEPGDVPNGNPAPPSDPPAPQGHRLENPSDGGAASVDRRRVSRCLLPNNQPAIQDPQPDEEHQQARNPAPGNRPDGNLDGDGDGDGDVDVDEETQQPDNSQPDNAREGDQQPNGGSHQVENQQRGDEGSRARLDRDSHHRQERRLAA